METREQIWDRLVGLSCEARGGRRRLEGETISDSSLDTRWLRLVSTETEMKVVGEWGAGKELGSGSLR